MACLFCGIVSGGIPAEILHRDDTVVAFRDINPKAPLHALVIPAAHIGSAADLTQAQAVILSQMFSVASKVAETAGVASSGYRLVFNVGADAGQSVDHLHLHVLGGRVLSWPPG